MKIEDGGQLTSNTVNEISSLEETSSHQFVYKLDFQPAH
jgi:hypothetical protein